MQETYYTVEQIAQMLHIHPKTVQRYIREGKLRAVKVGKGWRVGGHDLSVFTEGEAAERGETPTAVVSCVVDVFAANQAVAIRIVNTLTAGLNSKPAGYGQCSMQTQYIPQERTLRVTLYGGARVTAAMLDAIAALTEEPEENA
ncbi:MAG: helix-turn-helix domain-containing protein [Eubacteriales bacterium]|nr:helix-turn-helix domain-containing protein [Eubacteriales bacterium]